MRIETFSIVAGSMACNGRCPFCVAGATPTEGINSKEPEVNWRNFEKACEFAKSKGVTTAMITSKGEATIFPGQITKFMKAMEKYRFPLIEMQTNGIMIAEDIERYLPYLREWYELGMTTVAISIVHYNAEKNRQNYLPHKKEYIDLPKLFNLLHALKFSVRLTCVGAKGFIDSSAELRQLIGFARLHQVEQLTYTPVNKPKESRDDAVSQWVDANHLPVEGESEIRSFLEAAGTKLLRLSHGAMVYDVAGQNVCLNQCLTLQPENEELRNLIFFPSGRFKYNWEKEGAILL